MVQSFKTYQLSLELYQACEKVQCAHYIRDQLLRAALSVTLNLAERSANPTPKERSRFYSISLASLREIQARLEILKRKELWPLADQLGACLYRLTHPKVPLP